MGRLSAASAVLALVLLLAAVALLAAHGPGSAYSTTVVLPVNVEFRGVGLAVGLAAAAVAATTFLVIAGLQTASAMRVLARDRRVPEQLQPHAQLVRRVLLAPLAMRGIDLEHDPELPAIALPAAAELAAVVRLHCTVLIPAHDEEAVLAITWTPWPPRHRDGRRPAKSVFVLAADVHDGGVHLLHSQRREAPHDHRRNRLLYQLTSSPVSKAPSDGFPLNQLLETLPSTVDLAAAEFLKDNPDRTSPPITLGPAKVPGVTRFVLDSHRAQAYAAEYFGVLPERNIGRLHIEHVSARSYQLTATIEGLQNGLAAVFEIDLDAPQIQPHDEIGTSTTVHGRPVMLRVHEPGTGFGPHGDHVPGEVVVALDTAPGRFFGFSLNGDTHTDGTGILDLLRTAFSPGAAVTVEARSKGPANGIATRVFARNEQ